MWLWVFFWHELCEFFKGKYILIFLFNIFLFSKTRWLPWLPTGSNLIKISTAWMMELISLVKLKIWLPRSFTDCSVDYYRIASTFVNRKHENDSRSNESKLITTPTTPFPSYPTLSAQQIYLRPHWNQGLDCHYQIPQVFGTYIPICVARFGAICTI